MSKAGEEVVVHYSRERWNLFKKIRLKAYKIMSCFEEYGIKTIVFGSVARGDVTKTSDIDIVIPYRISSAIVENILYLSGFSILRKEIVKATPLHSFKAYLYIEEKVVISFPLEELSFLEREFYRFGGELNLRGIKEDKRVPGVDKRLMFIQPIKDGHIEFSIIGRESEVADRLGVSLQIVLEREKVLLKRKTYGRTGVYVKRILLPFQSIEEELEKLMKKTSKRKP